MVVWTPSASGSCRSRSSRKNRLKQQPRWARAFFLPRYHNLRNHAALREKCRLTRYRAFYLVVWLNLTAFPLPLLNHYEKRGGIGKRWVITSLFLSVKTCHKPLNPPHLQIRANWHCFTYMLFAITLFFRTLN